MSESMSPFNEDRPETGSWAAQMLGSETASEPVSDGFDGSVWQGSAVVDASAPAPGVVSEVEPGRLPAALLAGVGAALTGGLVWAGVVIVTRFDLGILAWVVGAGTGLGMVRVAGRPIGIVGQVLAGTFAAGGIMVGKYVVFVHDVRKTLGTLLTAQGQSIGYLDTRQMSIFVHNFGSIVRPGYALWVALAFFAAVRTAGGKQAFTRSRRR